MAPSSGGLAPRLGAGAGPIGRAQRLIHDPHKARWHFFPADEETAAPVNLLFSRWVQTARRGARQSPEPQRGARGSGWGIAQPGGSSFPALLQSPVSSEDKLPLDQMGAGCLWDEGGKDPAPLTLSLWNSLTQEMWKPNVAALVGMQMAADVDAHGDKGSSPGAAGTQQWEGSPKSPSLISWGLPPCQDSSLCLKLMSRGPCPSLSAAADHGEGIALLWGLRVSHSPMP